MNKEDKTIGLIIAGVLGLAFLSILICILGYLTTSIIRGFEAKRMYKKVELELALIKKFETVRCYVSSGGDWDPYFVTTELKLTNGFIIRFSTMGDSFSDIEQNGFILGAIYSADKKYTNNLTNYNCYRNKELTIESLPKYKKLYSKDFHSAYDFFSNIDIMAKEAVLRKDREVRGESNNFYYPSF